MYEAAMTKQPQPRVVASDPRDTKKAKLLKELVCSMVVYEPQQRRNMRDVLKCLEAIDQSAGHNASVPFSILIVLCCTHSVVIYELQLF